MLRIPFKQNRKIVMNRIYIRRIIGTLVLIAGLLAAGAYIFIGERSEFTADFTDTLVWAAASVESGSLVNPDFWYAYLLPFGGSLIMFPLVKIFGVTYFAHELGMLVFTLIFATAMLLFAISLGLDYGYSSFITGISLVLFLSSDTTRTIFYGHIIHYSLAMLFAFVAFFLINHIGYIEGSRLNGKQRILYFLLFLWLFFCCLNGESTIILFFIPFAGALMLERLIDIKIEITWKKTGYSMLLFLGILAGGAAGYLAKKLFLHYKAPYEEFFSAFMPSNVWMFKDYSAFTGFVMLFTGNVEDHAPVMSTNGILVLIMYALACIVVITPVFALISYKRMDKRMRILVLYYWILLAATLFIYSVTYAQTANWRLCALFGMAVIVTLIYCIYLLENGTLKRFGVLLSLGICICALGSLYLSLRTFPAFGKVNKFDEIIKVLDENGLTYGYSSYWNSANAVTILSDSRIKARSIVIDEETGAVTAHLYNAKDEWYDDQPDVDRYFVVLDQNEKKLCSELTENAVEEIEYNDNTYILIFDKNIFKDGSYIFE